MHHIIQLVTVVVAIMIASYVLRRRIREVLSAIRLNKKNQDDTLHLVETIKNMINSINEANKIIMIANGAVKTAALIMASKGKIPELKIWYEINRLSPPYVSNEELPEIGNAFCTKTLQELIKQQSTDSIEFLINVLKMNPNRIIEEETGNTMAHYAMKARVSKETIDSLLRLNIDFENIKNGNGVVAIDIHKEDPEVKITDDAKESIAAKKADDEEAAYIENEDKKKESK